MRLPTERERQQRNTTHHDGPRPPPHVQHNRGHAQRTKKDEPDCTNQHTLTYPPTSHQTPTTTPRSLPHSPLPRGTGKHQRPHKHDDALLSRAAASNIKRAIEPRTAVHVRKRRTPNEAPASTAMTHQHAPTTRLHHRNLRLETYRAPCRPPYMSRRELCPHGCG